MNKMVYVTNQFEIKNIPDTVEVFGAHVEKAEKKGRREYFKIINGLIKRLNDQGVGAGKAKKNWREKGWDILIPKQNTDNLKDFFGEIKLDKNLEISCDTEYGLKQVEELIKPAINSKLREDFLDIAFKHVSKNEILNKDEAKTAFKVRTSIIPESNIITVKVDKTHKMMYPFKDQHLKGIENGDEIDCRVIPYWSKGKIVSITDKVAKECMPDSERTYVDYWRHAYGLFVDPDDKILEVRFDEGKSFQYPRSTIFREFTWDMRKNRKLSSSPHKRLNASINFVKNQLKNIDLGPLNLSIDSKPLTIDDLRWDVERYEDSRKIKVRLIDEESKSKTCCVSNVKNSLSKGNIPVNGKKELKLILFVPEGFTFTDKFIEIAQRQYKKLNLGKIELFDISEEGAVFECKRRIDSYTSQAERAHRATIDEKEKPLAIVIAPKGTPKDFFYDVRKILHQPNTVIGQNPIPAQYLKEKTANDIVKNNSHFEINNIVAQLYVKGSPLSPNKAIWTLAENADKDINKNAGTTCYASFDTSRHTEIATGASAYSSVSDSRGEYVISGQDSFSGEKLTEKGFYKILKNLITKVSVRRDNLERLVLYRDGKDDESEMMEKVIDGGIEGDSENFPPLKEMLKRSEVAPNKLILDIIFVNKSPIDRIFFNGNYIKNVLPGYFFKKTERSGLLISAKSRKGGTVKPLELNFGLRKSIGHDDEEDMPPIEKLGNEYYRLTFLNWSSFYSQGKEAITQKLTQELGKNIARNVPTPKFTIYI